MKKNKQWSTKYCTEN